MSGNLLSPIREDSKEPDASSSDSTEPSVKRGLDAASYAESAKQTAGGSVRTKPSILNPGRETLTPRSKMTTPILGKFRSEGSRHKGASAVTSGDMSARTKMALEEVEKLKHKASEISSTVITGMSPMSQAALQELKKLRIENDRLENLRLETHWEMEPTSIPTSSGEERGMSARTRVALEEVEKLKRENSRLQKKEVSESSSMSGRTKAAYEELDKLRIANKRLMEEKQSDVRRVEYLEREYETSTKARVKEIRSLIRKAQELDIAFLLDATFSMDGSFAMVRKDAADMAAGIRATYPQCRLRIAFAVYRDYAEHECELHSADVEKCDFTDNFVGEESTFIRALSRVKCTGGGDIPEDVFTGLERAAKLDWRATSRLLVHIADAPCHGTQFHDISSDAYPGGDKRGREIGTLLQKLRLDCAVSQYFFCHLTEQTKKMVHEFRKACGDDAWVDEGKFTDISKVPEKIVTLSRKTIAKSLSVIHGGDPAMNYVPEVVEKKFPLWNNIKTVTALQYSQRRYHPLDSLLTVIRNNQPLDMIELGAGLLQIAPHPFTDDGAIRWPYHAKLVVSDRPLLAKATVVKRFKQPFGVSPRHIHAKERYVSQMEVQTVSAHMAEEFNRSTSKLRWAKKVEFTDVSTIEVGEKFFNMEPLLEGEWIKYSDNTSYVNTVDYRATLHAFSHWTYHRSRGLLMVTDLQGVRLADPAAESGYIFRLCDPAIHTLNSHVMRFTRTNLGEEGFSMFFKSHNCNNVCRHLGLPSGDSAGITDAGTKVTYR